MKSWFITAIVAIIGFGLGWQATTYGLAQPWWPLSVSGQPEVVAWGRLVTNPSGQPSGLVVLNSDQNTYVDISRFPVGTGNRHLNRPVTVRGLTVNGDSGTYLLVSWLR